MSSNGSFRVCEHCNQRIPADSVFCSECGSSLHPTRVSRQSRTARSGGQSSSALWGLIGAGILVVVVLVIIHQNGSGTHHAVTASAPRQHHSGKPSVATTPHSSTSPKHPTTPPTSTHKKTTSGSTTHTGVPSKSKTKTPPKTKTTHPKSTTPPPTIQAGFETKSVSYEGATISLVIPRTLTESTSRISSTEWRWGNSGNAAYQVVVNALPPSSSPPAGAITLGPDAYGTAITASNGISNQTLYVDWPGHAWIAVAMTVPTKDSSWLGDIAQTVKIG